MARTGGRRIWIAIPVTLLCFAVVGALIWLALPLLPASIDWAGDSLRAASERAQQQRDEANTQTLDSENIDCRNLYPDDLWSELVWTSGALLDQDTDPPNTRVVVLVEVLMPTVRVNCTWNEPDGGRIVTTLSAVAADAAVVAEQTMTAEGFACTANDDALVCTRNRDGIREEHTIREGYWLAHVQNRWLPQRYGTRIDAHLWG